MRIIVFMLTLVMVSGCTNNQIKTSQHGSPQKSPTPIKEHLVLAALWQQHAAEYQALCYQAYNIAKHRIDWLSANHKSTKPLAIIADIDETVLDNSPYSSKLIKEDINYATNTWVEWGLKASAEPVPGALSFYQYAAAKGFTVFYVSNRRDVQKQETIQNLHNKGFPFANAAHVLLRTAESGKEARRLKVLESYDVMMLLGDNLSDFHEAFDDSSSEERSASTKLMEAQFGGLYIVLPNPMYGDWEVDGLYEGKYDWTEVEKAAIRKNKLKPD